MNPLCSDDKNLEDRSTAMQYGLCLPVKYTSFWQRLSMALDFGLFLKINLLPLIEVPISDVGAIQYQCIHNMDSIDSALSFALRNTWRKSVT